MHYFLEYRFISLGLKTFATRNLFICKKNKVQLSLKIFFVSTMLKDSKTLGKKALEGFGVPLGSKKEDLYE